MATRERSTLRKIIEEGLVLRLRRPRTRAAAESLDLPVSSKLGGIGPGVHGTSNRSLFDAADV